MNKYLQKVAAFNTEELLASAAKIAAPGVDSLKAAHGTMRFVGGAAKALASPKTRAALSALPYAYLGASAAGKGNRIMGALAGVTGGGLSHSAAEQANKYLLKNHELYVPFADTASGLIGASASGRAMGSVLDKNRARERTLLSAVPSVASEVPAVTLSKAEKARQWIKANPQLSVGTAAGALAVPAGAYALGRQSA